MTEAEQAIYPEAYPDSEVAALVGDGVPGHTEKLPEELVGSAEPGPVPPAPTVAPHKLCVWFDFAKGDFRDKSRVVLNGVIDIRTQGDLEAGEALIRNQLGYDRVLITNWKKLEG